MSAKSPWRLLKGGTSTTGPRKKTDKNKPRRRLGGAPGHCTAIALKRKARGSYFAVARDASSPTNHIDIIIGAFNKMIHVFQYIGVIFIQHHCRLLKKFDGVRIRRRKRRLQMDVLY